MTELTLLEDARVPIFQLLGLRAVFDTGAEISVCNLSRDVFEHIFANNCTCLGQSGISGFGGEAQGYKYKIFSLKIGDMDLKNVEFFIPDESKVRHKIVLAGTVFKDYAYTIDMSNHKLTIYT